MVCPHCGSRISSSDRFCQECGSKITQLSEKRISSPEANNALDTAGSLSLTLGKAAREARLSADYSNSRILSVRAYNTVLLGVLLWGLLVNVVLCLTVGDLLARINPILYLIVYIVLVVSGIFLARMSANPLVSFLGYNLIVFPFGVVISSLVTQLGGPGSVIVTGAFVYTALISVGMLGAVLAFPDLFKKLGGALLGCLTGLVLCEILLLLFGFRQSVTDWIAAGIFSLYIGYDLYRSQQFTRTLDNAVDCALDLYLDIANLFIRVLRIMARSKK